MLDELEAAMKAVSEEDRYDEYRMFKCGCGHPVCRQYRISGQLSVGFEEETARLICLAVNNLPALIAAARERDAMRVAGAALVAACDQMIEDTGPIFAEMELVRGRGPYAGKQIGEELEALRAALATTLEESHYD